MQAESADRESTLGTDLLKVCCDSFVLFIWTRVGRPTFNALSSSTPEISMDSEKMHIPIWKLSMALSMQAALHMDPNYAKNLTYSRILKLKSVQCYEHDDCRKFKNKVFFIKVPRTHRGRDPHCLLIKQ